MRVVIFKVNHLGDNVVFLPIVQTLRRRFPDWRVTVITAEPERSLYTADLPPERIWTAPDRVHFNHSWRRPWRFARWLARLRAERPDACLLSYDQSNTAHLLAKWSGARHRIGATLPYLRVSNSLSRVVNQTPAQKIADWNWAMARALVADLAAGDFPSTPPVPDIRHLVSGPIMQRGPVVIHAGARSTIRRWGAARMTQVAERLVADGRQLVWIERPDAPLEKIPPGVIVRRCDTLADLAQTLAGASLLLCNNSGPMHLANALGTPLVVISGPSSRDWDPYWQPDRTTVLRHVQLPCIACEDSNLGTDVCANTAAPRACLDYWSVDAVTAACRQQLQTGDTGKEPVP